eukprot:gene14618-10189_t
MAYVHMGHAGIEGPGATNAVGLDCKKSYKGITAAWLPIHKERQKVTYRPANCSATVNATGCSDAVDKSILISDVSEIGRGDFSFTKLACAPRNGVTSGGSDVGWMVEDGVPSGRSSNKNSIVTENKLFIGIPKEGATISPRHVAAAQEENEDEFGDDDPLFTCDKKTIMGLLAFCALIAVVFLIGQSKPVKALFFNFLETVENASWGAPLMILCLLVMVPAMIPTTPFNVAAGYLFGWAGLPVLMVGAIGGAQIAFLLCRVCLASWARKKLANLKLFKLIDNLSADDDSKLSWRSFKIVLLTRGSPIFPFPLINYAHGVTRVSAMSYFLGTGVGMLPWLTLDVYFGGLLKSLEDVENGHSKGYLITVGISSVITTIYITFK